MDSVSDRIESARGSLGIVKFTHWRTTAWTYPNQKFGGIFRLYVSAVHASDFCPVVPPFCDRGREGFFLIAEEASKCAQLEAATFRLPPVLAQEHSPVARKCSA